MVEEPVEGELVKVKPMQPDRETLDLVEQGLHNKVCQVLNKALIQSEGLKPLVRYLAQDRVKPDAEQKLGRPIEGVKNVATVLKKLRKLRWFFDRSQHKDDRLEYESGAFPAKSAVEVLGILTGLKQLEEQQGQLPGKKYSGIPIPPLEEVLAYPSGFLVEAKVPKRKTMFWRGLLQKIGDTDNFFLSLRLFQLKKDKLILRETFSYRPLPRKQEEDITGTIGALEYRNYQKGYSLFVPIPAASAENE